MASREDGPMHNTVSDPRRWSRLAWVLLPAALFLVVIVLATLRQSGPPAIGDEAPSFEAPLLDGSGSLALSDLEGRPALINFWASWCIPCREEAPLLKEAYERYGDEVAFVGVNIKDARDDALAFDEEFALQYPDVRDEGSVIFSDFGLTGQPETFLIDSSGKVVQHINGPLPDMETLDSLMAELL